MPTARYHGLDFLRASMMLLGVVLHVVSSYIEAPAAGGWPLRDPNGSGFAGLVVLTIHVFRMPAFFALSGFFGAIVVARRGMGAWLADRVRRIAFPMVVAWIVLFPMTKLAFTYALGRAAEATGTSSASVPLIGTALSRPWANPSPIHLWFLLYLLALSAIAAALWAASRALPADARRRIAELPARWISGWRGIVSIALLALATTLPMCAMDRPGIATPSSFALDRAVLACYAVYFFGGWMIAPHPRAIDALRAGAWWRLSAGVFALVVSVVLAIAWFVGAGSTQPADGPVMRILLFATQSSGAVAAWLLILGGAGVAERVVRASSRPLRVLVDSSYWVYLVHLPICVLVTGLLIPWSAPGLVKMVVAITGSVLLLALGYAATLAVLPRRVRPEPCLQPEVRTLPQ